MQGGADLHVLLVGRRVLEVLLEGEQPLRGRGVHLQLGVVGPAVVWAVCGPRGCLAFLGRDLGGHREHAQARAGCDDEEATTRRLLAWDGAEAAQVPPLALEDRAGLDRVHWPPAVRRHTVATGHWWR
jgi:hypothetical protein